MIYDATIDLSVTLYLDAIRIGLEVLTITTQPCKICSTIYTRSVPVAENKAKIIRYQLRHILNSLF